MGIRDASLGAPVLDEIRVSEIGRLRRTGVLTQREYDAGVRYGNIMLLYLASIDAPCPYGGDLGNLSDDICFQRKMQVAAAKTILRDISPRCMRVVDRVTVYDEPVNDDLEIFILKKGLAALSGVPMDPDAYDTPKERTPVWDTIWGKMLSEFAGCDTKEIARLKNRYKLA